MALLKNNFFKRIIVILSVFMILTSFIVSPMANAAVKTQMEEGEFYYSGTTEGSYIVTQDIFSWLLEKIGEIVDFLLGLMTMGGRMVFVGWTALFEELITWALEASVGVPMDIENNVNATSTDGFIDSSNNVTIEAIVYNQVPILNVNLFENPKSSCVSGTGKFFVVCETCYNIQNPPEPEQPRRNMYAPQKTTIVGKNQKICTMEDCTCQDCWNTLAEAGYFETDSSGNIVTDAEGMPVRTSNAVTLIKDSVSKWYYVLRLIAIAGMLCVLLVVGIKMAISNIASDKALYKRMLWDWVIGIIILFLIHYFMVIAINVNQTFVEFLKDTQKGVTETAKKELYMDNKSNQDLEIGIYQAVRTRAYDPKLINGTTGMILYITLVFYTIKFVFIYLKRYLTVIILTLVAPGVAFSYAIQRVFSGKSQAFSKWMHEYFTNVFLQTIHALVYTVFVTTALVISLNSVSGMIIAFVFINFMLKADDIFRKIFKLSSGSVNDAMNAAQDAKGLMQSAKSAASFMTAGNLLKNSPVTKAVKAPLKMAGTGAVLAASKIASGLKDNKIADRKDTDIVKDTGEETLDDVVSELQRMRENMTPGKAPKKDFANFLKGYNKKHGVNFDGEEAIEKELTDLEKLAAVGEFSDDQKQSLAKLRDKFDKLTNISTADVFKAHISKFLNEDNYYEYDEKTGKRRLKYGIFGKRRFDRVQNRWVRDSLSDLVAEQLKSENLLGFTEKDKKLWKEGTTLFRNTLVGMGSMFVGLGTVVSSPAVGFGLLATGSNNMMKFYDEAGVFDPNRTYRRPIVDEKHKKYSFNRFGKGAKKNITRSILENAEKEKDAVIVENVRKNHTTLYRALKLGGIGLTVAGAINAAPVALGTGAVAYTVGKGIKKYSGYSQKSFLGRVSKNHFDEYKALRKELLEDDIRVLSKEEENEMKNYYAELTVAIGESLNSSNDIDENVRRNEEKIALEAGDAIKLESGETLILSKPQEKFTSKDLNDKAVIDIIDEAVAKTMIDKVLSQERLASFKTEDIQEDAKKLIEQKLVAHGVLQKGELDTKIKGIEREIDRSAKNIMNKELKGNSSIMETLENTDKVEVENLNLENTNKDNKPTQKVSAFDKALINTVIEQAVKDKQIKSTADLSTETIMESVKQKRETLIEKQSGTNVVELLQASKTTEQSVKQKRETLIEEKSGTNVIELLQASKRNEQIGTEQQTYAEKVKLSASRENIIRSGIAEMKRTNKPAPPKEEAAKRVEMKKRIAALDEILMAVATEEEQTSNEPDTKAYKSADEVIQELFDNTEDREKAYLLLENIKNMKKLNKRADNAKMKTKNPRYHNAKNSEDRKKAFEKYPDAIPNGDRVYQGGDGRKDISKEVYGPVTDIVSILEELKINK